MHSRRFVKRKPLTALFAVVPVLGTLSGVGFTTFRASSSPEKPVLVVSADPSESAAVMALMKIRSHTNIGPYVYYKGTIDGHPVIDVTSMEMTESAEAATAKGDAEFHPKATLWVGTAGANMADLHVGDVVLGGYVIDKSQVHNHDQSELSGAPSTFQTVYGGTELFTGPGTDTRGDILSPDTTESNNWEFVSAMAGNLELAKIALRANVGSVSLANATGDSSETGSIANRVILGTTATCNCWTEPLQDVSAQNALMPSDSESNEDTGFTWANQEAGVPSLNIRDLSDSPWEPNAYDGTDSGTHGAAVARYVVDHMPARVSLTPVTFNDLSPDAAAKQYGYQVADEAFDDVTPVTRIDTPSGTMPASQLAGLLGQYQLGKDGLP